MKTQLILYILFSLQISLLAQPKFFNLSSQDPNDKELYIGVENYIGLQTSTYFVKNVRFSISHGTLTKVGPNKYLINVAAEKPDTLKLYEDDSLVHSETYQVKKVPYPIAQLANTKDTLLTVKQILANPIISVYLPDCKYKHQFQVLSFRTRFSKSNMNLLASFDLSIGSYLPDKQIKTVKSLKTNDKIQFYDIIYKCPKCGTQQLNSLTITIK
ncbi:MAG: hypothetical protein J0M30_07065 [Chitinophagales bacterium]|nr:hypothetical protein [Chitinophagales bacterium]